MTETHKKEYNEMKDLLLKHKYGTNIIENVDAKDDPLIKQIIAVDKDLKSLLSSLKTYNLPYDASKVQHDIEIKKKELENETDDDEKKILELHRLTLESNLKKFEKVASFITEHKTTADDIRKEVAAAEEKKNQKLIEQMEEVKYKDLFLTALNLPKSPEKYLKLIMALSKVLHLGGTNISNNGKPAITYDVQTELEAAISNLKNFKELEFLDTQSISDFLKVQNYRQASARAGSILSKIQSFDTDRMIYLLEKAKESEAQITGKDIIIVLGCSGSGKSTLIHYLVGSKMEKVLGTKHIRPVKVPEALKKYLENVVPSESASSETKFITGVPIVYNNKLIIITDSPGFDDTEGPEADVAGTIGLIRAIKTAKSVKPVIVFSARQMGTKAHYVKQLVNIVINLIPAIEDRLTELTVAFTGTDVDNLSSINHMLKSVLEQSLLETEAANKSFVALLNWLVKQSDPKNKTSASIVVNHLNENEKDDVLDFIISRASIPYPKDAFACSLSENSKKCVNLQVQQIDKSIIQLLADHNYVLIEHKLKELNALGDALEKDYFHELELKNGISMHLQNLYYKSKNLLSDCTENKLKENRILEFKENLKFVEDAQILKKFFPSTGKSIEWIVTERFNECIQKNGNDLVGIIKKIDFFAPSDFSLGKIALFNLGCFAEHFTSITHSFEQTLTEITQKIDLSLNLCSKFITDNNYKMLCNNILIIQKFLNDISSFIPQSHQSVVDKWKSKVDVLDEQLDEHYKEILQKLRDISNGTYSSKFEIVYSIYNVFSKMEENLHSLNSIFDQLKFESYISTCHEILINKFQDIQTNISNLVEENFEENYEQIELQMKELMLFDKFDAIKMKIDKREIMKLIWTKMEGSRSDLSRFLENTDDPTFTINFEFVSSNYKTIKNYSWMETFDSSFAISELLDKICSYIHSVYDSEIQALEKKQFEISASNFNLIPKIGNLYLKNHTIDPLFYKIPQLKEKSDRVHSLYYEALGKVLNEIENYFEEKIDSFVSANDYLEYLMIAKEKDKINSIKIQKIYLKGLESVEKKKDEIKDMILRNLKKIYDEEFEDIFAVKTSIIEQYKKINSIGKLKLISEQLNIDDVKSEIKEYFSNELYSELNGNLQTYSSGLNVQDQSELLRMLQIAKNLSSFDILILGEPKFSQLWIQEHGQFFKTGQQHLDEIKQQINLHDYAGVSTTLAYWKDDNVQKRSYNIAKEHLWKVLSIFIDETKTQIILMSRVFDDVQFQKIVSKWRILDRAKNFILQFLNEEQNSAFISDYNEIQNNIKKRVNELCKTADRFITANNFKMAEETIEDIQKCIELLRLHSDKTLMETFDKLKEDQHNGIKKKVESFKKVPVSDYPQSAPKEILKNLEECRLKEDSQNLISNITEKVRAEIKAPDSPIQMKRTLNKIERILESTIGKDVGWALNLMMEIDDAKKSITEDELIIQSEIDRSIEHQDFELMREKLEECQLKQDKQNEFKINESIISNIHNIQIAIAKLLKNEEGLSFDAIKSEFTNHLKNIIRMKDIFGKTNSNTVKAFEYVKKDLIQYIYNSYKSIVDLLGINKTPNSKVMNDFVYAVKLSLVVMRDLKLVSAEESKTTEYFRKIRDTFTKMKEECNSKDLTKVVVNLSTLKGWNDIVILLMLDFPPPGEISRKVIEEIQNAQTLFEMITIVTPETKENEKKRVIYFEKKEKHLNFLRAASKIKETIDPENKYEVDKIFDECLSHFQKEKIDKAVDPILSKKTISGPSILQSVNHIYNSLETIEFIFKDYKINSRLNDLDLHLEAIVEEIIADANKNLKDGGKLAANLYRLQEIGSNIGLYQKNISDKIASILSMLKTNNSQFVFNLATELNKDPNGSIIVETYSIFKSEVNKMFNNSVKNMDYVLDGLDIEGFKLKKDALRSRYKSFEDSYNRDINMYIHKRSDLSELISLILNEVASLKNKHSTWNLQIKDSLPTLMAHLFTLWTLKDAENMEESTLECKEHLTLKKPHAGQVISIFLILGIGVEESSTGYFNSSINKGLKNHFVQIGTGEGKSVTLAIASTILALYDYEVNCCCYSNYLSSRDYQDFMFLFDALNVTRKIKYGTFNSLFEDLINDEGDIRQTTQDLILKNKTPSSKKVKSKSRGKVLLIDEVDKFFSTDFYSKLYNPTAKLQDPLISDFIIYLWEFNKQNPIYDKKTFHTIQQSNQYKELIKKFKNWEYLINEEIKNMFSSIKNYEQHSYEIKDEKIGYIDQDEIVFNINRGYQTLFAYFKEHERGRVSKQNLENNIYMTVNCGSFAYAEIPLQFDSIYGVSGTLRTLLECKLQRKVVEEQFNIRKFSFTPSVFGNNNLEFAKDKDTKIENLSDYHIKIKQEIDNSLVGSQHQRAVLVFFRNAQKLHEFYNSDCFSSMRDTAQIFTEGLSNSEKKTKVNNATLTGAVSLLTASYGRGTDFICRDQRVKSNSGVHVIQTFLSEDLSEEIQIKGRTARQGGLGSYSMVLLDVELEHFQVFKEDITKMRSKGEYYDILNEKRMKLYETKYQSSNNSLDTLKNEHQKSLAFKKALFAGDVQSIKNYLNATNIGSSLDSTSKTICLMDATYSMSSLLDGAKNTVHKMFERTRDILREHNLPENCFELQFCVYRNYNCNEKKLFECSPFESNATNLRDFMETIGPDGGMGNEAIEVGFQYIAQTTQKESIDQVILIGDANPNSKQEVTEKRNYKGENYWSGTKYKEAVYWESELKKINVPVHAFYVDNRAKKSFEDIANRTKGNCSFLDINSTDGSEKLLNSVTLELLKIQSNGNELVETYVKKYM